MKPNTILQRMVVMLITLMCAIGANAAEAYACYTPENNTLTFYYDNYRNSRSGTTYDLNTDHHDPDWLSYDVTNVVFHSSFANARPTTTYAWFYAMRQLQSIEGLSYLNTSEVTNMDWMFGYCSSLKSLDLSSFNTAIVTDMDYMFNGCTSLQTIYAGSGWRTNTVSSSLSMFSDCSSLKGGRGTTWNSSNPTDKTYAHIDGGSNNPGYLSTPPEAYACYTSSNATLTFYFDNHRSNREGTTYDLNTGDTDTGWETDGTNSYVTKVVFDSSFANARPKTTYSWFYEMKNLESITGLSYLNTSEVTDLSWMFGKCENLTSLDLSRFNTSNVTSMNCMFAYCSKLESLDLSKFNTSKVTDMRGMFYGSTNLQTIYVGEGWSTASIEVIEVENRDYSNYMFSDCISLVGGKGTQWKETNPTNKTYAHIDGGLGNPGYLTDINSLKPYACYTPENTTLTFYYDGQRYSRSGTTYDLNTGDTDTGWETDGTNSYVTKVVFDSSFANARPKTTYSWFYEMKNLESITGLSYLNTSEVTDLSWMFGKCENLTSLDLSRFNTSNVTSMNCMFAYCSKLESLDLSKFNTSKVTDMRGMFYGSTNLQTIYVGEGWSTASIEVIEVENRDYSNYMFSDCISLVGGKGTQWKETNPTNKTYAHIDGGLTDPGYFTERTTGIATGIENGQRNSVKGQRDEWYDLSGRKLNGMPNAKGVYIQNGKKTVVH